MTNQKQSMKSPKCPKTVSGRHLWVTLPELKKLTGGFPWCQFCELVNDVYETHHT